MPHSEVSRLDQGCAPLSFVQKVDATSVVPCIIRFLILQQPLFLNRDIVVHDQ